MCGLLWTKVNTCVCMIELKKVYECEKLAIIVFDTVVLIANVRVIESLILSTTTATMD